MIIIIVIIVIKIMTIIIIIINKLLFILFHDSELIILLFWLKITGFLSYVLQFYLISFCKKSIRGFSIMVFKFTVPSVLSN